MDEHTSVDVTTPLTTPPNNVISIDIDIQTNDLYWVDESTNSIYCTPYTGGNSQVIIDSSCTGSRPTALAVDWIGRVLYWADSNNRRIELCSLNGTNRRVLFHEVGGEVSAIVLDIKH